MPRRKTDAEFRRQVYDRVGDEYTFLDRYINANTKIRVRHNQCGHIYSVVPYSFVNDGTRCPRCSARRAGLKHRSTDKQFQYHVSSQVGDTYTFLDRYTTATSNLRVRHNVCGYIYQVTPHSFLAGSRCPHCDIERRTRAETMGNEEFVQRVRKRFGDEYTCLDEYVDSQVRIRVRHNRCGTIFLVKPTDFLGGRRCCPHCSSIEFTQKFGMTDSEFRGRVYKQFGNEYSVMSKYVSYDYRVRIRHNLCGHTYWVWPWNLFRRKGCRYCNASQGERGIIHWLDEHQYGYKFGDSIPDLVDKWPLHFDFYFPDKKLAIEYDGFQHYKIISGNYDRLQNIRKHDVMKNQYCKDHRIRLVRIPYGTKVEPILRQELS